MGADTVAGRDRGRDRRPAGRGDPVPDRFRRRLGGRLGDHRPRGPPCGRSGQAGDRLDGRRRRLGRLLDRHGRVEDRRRRRHAHRLDRRVRRQAGARPLLAGHRRRLGPRPARRQRRHVEHRARLRRPRPGAARGVPRPDLRRLRRGRGARPGPVAGRRGQGRAGPRLDGCPGQGAGTGRRAGRLHPRPRARQGGDRGRQRPGGRAAAVPAGAAALGAGAGPARRQGDRASTRCDPCCCAGWPFRAC